MEPDCLVIGLQYFTDKHTRINDETQNQQPFVFLLSGSTLR